MSTDHQQNNANARQRKRLNQRAEIRRLHRHIYVLRLCMENYYQKNEELERQLAVAKKDYLTPPVQPRRRWSWLTGKLT